MPNSMKSNFSHLSSHSDQLLKLGLLAERYFTDDPNTCLLKLRQLAELLAQETAANLGMLTTSEESQFDLIRRLQDRNAITREVAQLFHEIRRTGNDANHALKDDFRSALSSLKLTWQLSLWFHRTFNDPSYRFRGFLVNRGLALRVSSRLAYVQNRPFPDPYPIQESEISQTVSVNGGRRVNRIGAVESTAGG